MDHRRLLSPTGSTLELLEKSVYQKLKKLRPQVEGKILIVAVSGGIDSVVLLHVLHNLQSRLRYKLHVAHINHGIRGRESDNDEIFVTELCKQLRVPLTHRKLKGLKINSGENILRQHRYDSLFEIREKLKSPFIVTAHHQDDLLETRLMRLLQGTGVHGLKAMTILNADGILRPMLHVTRRQIEEYSKAKDLDWRNDATNIDTTKFRNWIRRNWLGILRAEHPEYIPTLFNSLERIILNNPESTEEIPALAFDRSRLIQAGVTGEPDTKVYSYLRQYGKKRITSALITEFKKQLTSPKKKYSFRLAGVDWQVDKNEVKPLSI